MIACLFDQMIAQFLKINYLSTEKITLDLKNLIMIQGYSGKKMKSARIFGKFFELAFYFLGNVLLLAKNLYQEKQYQRNQFQLDCKKVIFQLAIFFLFLSQIDQLPFFISYKLQNKKYFSRMILSYFVRLFGITICLIGQTLNLWLQIQDLTSVVIIFSFMVILLANFNMCFQFQKEIKSLDDFINQQRLNLGYTIFKVIGDTIFLFSTVILAINQEKSINQISFSNIQIIAIFFYFCSFIFLFEKYVLRNEDQIQEQERDWTTIQTQFGIAEEFDSILN